MNKQQIIDFLIARTRSEIEQLRQEEKESLEAIDHEDQDIKNPFESTAESQTADILSENEALSHAEARLLVLERLAPHASNEVEVGSLVTLDIGTLLVATSFPPVEVDGRKVTGISIESPMYQKMQGMKKGATFQLDNHPEKYVIHDLA